MEVKVIATRILGKILRTLLVLSDLPTTGCFIKMYPILMPKFEEPRALMPPSITSYKSQNLYVLSDTSYDDFRCLAAELQPFF